MAPQPVGAPPRRLPAPAWFVTVLVPAVLMLMCLSPCLPHDLRLRRLKSEYSKLAHPAGSRVLEARSELGLLEGNGNHCDYFVGELRVAPVDEVTLKGFYGPTTQLDLIAGTPFLSSSPRDELLVIGSGVKAVAGETLYVVSLYDSEPPGVDFRCH